MNVITLTGNSTKDCEISYTPSGTAIAKGSIAVRRDFKNKQGEYETDFFNFVVIGKLGEVIANHVRKGDKFGITGRLQNRVWQKDDGAKQYFTEVVVNGFDFPNKSQNNQGNTNTGGSQQNRSNGNPEQNSGSYNPNGQNNNFTRVDDDPFANDGKTIDISDDDLPF